MRLSKSFKILWLFSLLPVLANGSPASLPTDSPDRPRVQNLSRDDQSRKLPDYVKVLTSESYGGRCTGTPEYRACADGVSSQCKKWGVRPAGQGSSYLQPFPSPYTLVLSPGEVSLRRGDGKQTYVYETDYFPGSNPARGRVEADVVYVGYGITAPEARIHHQASPSRSFERAGRTAGPPAEAPARWHEGH